jgi:hypothetical protein
MQHKKRKKDKESYATKNRISYRQRTDNERVPQAKRYQLNGKESIKEKDKRKAKS